MFSPDAFAENSPQRRLHDLMGTISQDCYEASWLIGLEETLWSLVAGLRPREDEDPSLEQIVALRALHEEAGGWWSCRGWMTTEQWLAWYAEHR